MKKSLLRMGEQLSIYLPVLLMALLALGTWWLVRNAPQSMQGHTQPSASAEPDYVMKDFSVYQFDASGRLQSEVLGDVAHHFPQSQTFEVHGIRTHSVAPDGTQTQTSARRGISNADASEVQLFGDAKVQQLPQGQLSQALTVESEFLHAWTLEERVQSHLPVVLKKGANVFAGDSMRYDNLAQVMELNGRVNVEIQSRNSVIK